MSFGSEAENQHDRRAGGPRGKKGTACRLTGPPCVASTIRIRDGVSDNTAGLHCSARRGRTGEGTRLG